MATAVVSANYQELERIAQQFATQQQQVQRLTQSLMTTVDQLRQGGWVADAANQYYRNMDQTVFPSLRRLSVALGHSQTTVIKIIQVFRQAEEDACAGLRGEGIAVLSGISSAQTGSSNQLGENTKNSIKDGDWIGDPYTAKAIVVNGIQNDDGDLSRMMMSVSGALGGVPVMGVYNATAGKVDRTNLFTALATIEGGVLDVGQTFADKFQVHMGFRIGPENPAVKGLVEAIRASDGQAPIIAHSQGGAITAAALKELSHTNFDLKKLTVITMGTAESSFPEGPNYIHYVHPNDVVPIAGELLNTPYYYFNPMTLSKAPLTGEVKISVVPSAHLPVSLDLDANHGFEAKNGIGGYINELKKDAQEHMIGEL